MAKFTCVSTPDLVIGTGRTAFQFKNYSYTTTKKDEIALLKNIDEVTEVGKTPPKPKTPVSNDLPIA